MYRNKFGSHYTVQFGEDVKYSPLSTSGLFVDDVEVLKAMDKELQGKFIPVKETKKKTIDARSHVVSEDDFNEIKRYIGKKLAETAEELYNGNITVSPLSCDYCDYKSVCGSICESKRETVKIKNAADLMAAIKEDETDGRKP